MRTALAGSSCISMTSDAASDRRHAPVRHRPGRCAAIASGGPTSRTSTSHSSTAASAPATISPGARSPPIASIAITGPRRSRVPPSNALSCYSTSRTCRPRYQPQLLHTVCGSRRCAAVRAQRVRRAGEPHVRRLARAGRGAAHLALRDGHRDAPELRARATAGPPTGGRARRCRSRTPCRCDRRRSSGTGPAQSSGTAARRAARGRSASRTSGSRSTMSSSRPVRLAVERVGLVQLVDVHRDRRPRPAARQRLHAACHGASTSPRTTMPSETRSSVTIDVRRARRDRISARRRVEARDRRRDVDARGSRQARLQQVGDRNAKRVGGGHARSRRQGIGRIRAAGETDTALSAECTAGAPGWPRIVAGHAVPPGPWSSAAGPRPFGLVVLVEEGAASRRRRRRQTSVGAMCTWSRSRPFCTCCIVRSSTTSNAASLRST